MHGCQSSCLKNHLQQWWVIASNSLTPQGERRWRRRRRRGWKEEARRIVIIHALNFNTRFWLVFVHSNLLPSVLMFRAPVVNSGAASDCKVFLTWQPRGKHSPRAAKLRSLGPLRETKTIKTLHLVSGCWSQRSPYFQHPFRGKWPDKDNNSCPTVKAHTFSAGQRAAYASGAPLSTAAVIEC